MKRTRIEQTPAEAGYETVLADVAELVEAVRGASARTVNALMTATYWSIGRRIVEQEQQGLTRADYGAVLIGRLAMDLTARFGRGFGRRNIFQMRSFYLAYRELPLAGHSQFMRPSTAAKVQTASALSTVMTLAGGPDRLPVFPLPWSHYVRLLGVRSVEGTVSCAASSSSI